MASQIPTQRLPPFGHPHLPNGSVSLVPPQPLGVLPPNKVIEKNGHRILCIADIRGNLQSLNELAKKANADYILHTGDFGFYDDSSLERIADKTLRHVVQYSPLLDESLKKRMQVNPPVPIKQLVAAEPNALSELPLFLSKKYTLDVPVYTVWGACEDVRVLEKFRSGEYRVHNLHIIDEASSRLLDVGGVKLRLLGLGGAVVMHKLFDNGEGKTTIAGGQGTMWTTLLQMGELVDTANRVYDPTETRIFITHASPAREGLLNQLSVTLKADFSISAGLHFRYGSSYNEFSVNPTLDHYRGKLASSKASFNDVWDTVKGEVMPAVQQNPAQQQLLQNALTIVENMPTTATGGSPFGGPIANAAPGAGMVDESAFKNMWNFNLADAAFGWLVLEVEGGRIGTEMRAQGFNFAHRGGKGSLLKPQAVPQSQPQSQPQPQVQPQIQPQVQPQQPPPPQQPPATIAPPSASAPSVPPAERPVPLLGGAAPSAPAGPSAVAPAPISPAVPLPPTGTKKTQQTQPAAPQGKVSPPPPAVPKPASPPAIPMEPKPATPRPTPTGPSNRTATPSTPVAPSPTPSDKASTNGTNGHAAVPTNDNTIAPVVPKTESPTPAAPQQENHSPQERAKSVGLYVGGCASEEDMRNLFDEETNRKFVRVEARGGPRQKFFLVYLRTVEETRDILDKLPAEYKVPLPSGQRDRKPYVKQMDDPAERAGYSSGMGSRSGMESSKWRGGSASESDNNMSGGYRKPGSYVRAKGRGSGFDNRGSGPPRGGRGGRRSGNRFDGGDNAPRTSAE